MNSLHSTWTFDPSMAKIPAPHMAAVLSTKREATTRTWLPPRAWMAPPRAVPPLAALESKTQPAKLAPAPSTVTAPARVLSVETPFLKVMPSKATVSPVPAP